MPNLIQKLLDEKFIKKNPQCKDNSRMFGESLVYSFGINDLDPTAPVNEETGYQRTKEFLSEVCGVFPNPTHIIGVSPFSNAYLGKETFERAIKIIVDRAKTHPDECETLDEVLTSAALVSPEKRSNFLDSVRDAETIDADFMGLSSLIVNADTTANFTSPDEFPVQFRTHSVTRATSLIGKFIENGFFVPGKGFTEKYSRLAGGMKGFDYMVTDPSPEHAILISPNADAVNLTKDLNLIFEFTPEYDARPNNNGINPSVALINFGVNPKDVKELYPQTTLLYIARSRSEKRRIENALEGRTELLAEAGDKNKVLRAHLNFINLGRRKNLVDFSEMLRSGVDEALKYAREGNEYFYDIRDQFEDMGRRGIIDDAIATANIKLPVRTNNKLVLLVSEYEKELLPYFEFGDIGKKFQYYKEIPSVEETGMPFVIITNKALTEAQVHERLPSATVLYFATNKSEEEAILKANGPETFVVNAQAMKKAINRTGEKYVGSKVVDMFFNEISTSRPKGVTRMSDIVGGISDRIRKIREEIVFGTNLDDYYYSAKTYWNMQQQYRGIPMISQQDDDVLMQTCPTGGCLKFTTEPYGGCGANYTDVLIDFAIAYRKQVGEDNFAKGLAKFHGGRTKNPWYIGHYRYDRQFREGIKKTTKFDMTF